MRRSALLLVAFCLFVFPAVASAQGDRVQSGEDITVEAEEHAKDVVCIFCSIRMLGQASGDVVAIFGDVEAAGPVGGDVVAVFGDVEVDGPVGGEVVATGGNIRLGPQAQVAGNVVSSGGKIERDPQAQVAGEVQSAPGPPAVGLAGLLVVVALIFLVTYLVLVLITFLIAGKQRVETIAATVRERGGLAALTGLGVLVAAIALFILSAFLGPVTPILAVLVALGLVVTLVVGYTGLSYWLGRALAKKMAPLAAALLGAVLITLLQLIPLLGFLLFLVFCLLALGCAALSGYGTSTQWLDRQFGRPAAIPPPPGS